MGRGPRGSPANTRARTEDTDGRIAAYARVTVLIVLSGMSGTGKSSIATGVGHARQAPVLSVDPIESAILRAGIAASFETGLAAYLVAEAVAAGCVQAGMDVVIDAVNSVDEARDMWRALARRHGVRLAIIECVLSDPVIHAQRVAGRDRGLALAEPTWADVERRKAEWTPWPEPHLILDAVDAAQVNLQKALAYLDAD